MQKIILFLFLISFSFAKAQEYNSIQLPNTFQHPDNPYYWKNKKPSADYWQQDVSYKIHATIDEKTDILHGKETLTYWNNSPDTLYFVYFHLYANQAVKGSYLDKLNKANNENPSFGKYQDQELGIEILAMQNNGKDLKTEEDNTILKVYLEEPLAPNKQTTFDIIFKSFYDNGSIRRRMKAYKSYGKTHYNGAHWYPRIAVYDRKFGWTTDQHLGREFYGDFGTYDVTLNFANDYIVGATGNLLNREEMYPAELWEKLKIENFKDKPWNEKPSEIIKREDGLRKEWHFYAENIPDFAFVANPHFRIGVAEWNGKKAYAFAEESHASKWQNAAEYTANILRVFSTDFGMYGWHKMLVTDARDGMEYPMLTMDGGSEPGYRGLLVHEVGHNWFYGMVNNNETYRAFMDEGFTQFLTAWGMEALDGPNVVEEPTKNWYLKMFDEPINVRESKVYYGYLRDATINQDPQLNTHSDGFHGALGHGGGYGHVYYKTAAMLYNLEYTLGDTLFLNAMKYYFNKWSFAHPYPEDFRQSIIEFTKVDLNWFFDQWLETTKNIDYKITSITNSDSEDNSYNITFKRKGSMQMPLDFRVTDKAGNNYDYHIPNTFFEKKTDASVLPRWIGWDKLNKEYTATVTLPKTEDKKVGNIDNVVIDHTDRLADINQFNNRLKGNVDWKFDSHTYRYPDRKKYTVFYRPDIWWNAYDGLKVGGHLRGNYMNRKHIFDLLAGFNTRLLQANLPEQKAKHYTNGRFYYNFNYTTALDKFIPFSKVEIQSRFLDGLALNQIKLTKDFSNNIDVSIGFKSMIRPEKEGNQYLLYPNEWETQKWNNTVFLGVNHDFYFNKKRGVGNVKANIITAVFSDYKDLRINLEFKGKEKLGPLDISSRLYGLFRPKNIGANESSLYLAGANPEEMMENKYVRSSGFYPVNWIGDYGGATDHAHYGGGLNLRGYAGYNNFIQNDKTSSYAYAYKGNSGASFNFEIGFDRMIKLKNIPKFLRNFDLDVYVFGDFGVMTYTDNLGIERAFKPMSDGGLGAAFTIKKFGPLQGIKPLVIRFDMPFYVSDAPSLEKNFKYRWVIGINRAF